MKICRHSESTDAPLASPTSRRELLQLAVAAACWPLLAAAQERGRELLPLRTTGLQHFGMQVADVEVAGQFYGRLFSPTLTKEAEPPLRYYVKLGSDSIAIGGANGRPSRIDHYCALIEDYRPPAMIERLRTEGLTVGNQGLVGDPDGLRLQLLGMNESVSSLPAEALVSRRPSVRITDEGPVVTPIALERVVLMVSDLERALPFYRLFFGAESRRDADGAWFQLADTRLGVLTAPRGEPPRIDHYCVNVAPFDRDTVAAKLTALGATLVASDDAHELHFMDRDGIHVVLRAA
jgi:predicted enzyme related to lactoylglutathione lyase